MCYEFLSRIGQKSDHRPVLFLLTIAGFIALTIGCIEFLCTWPAPLLTTLDAKTDTLGANPVMTQKPQRIVSQTLATDEILLALCPPERIVALSALATNDDYSHIVEAAKQIVKSPVSDSVEAILMLNPDLILVTSYNRIDRVNLLQASGSQILRLNHFRHLSDIKNNIRRIGYAIGEEERAHLLINEMEQTIIAIRQKIPKNVESPKVLFYDSWGNTAGRHTFFDDMVELVHAVNLASIHQVEGYIQLNQEFIQDWQPEVIVTTAVTGEFEQTRRRLQEHPMIAITPAGKLGRIIVIDHRDFNATSHHIVAAMVALVEGLYTTYGHHLSF